MVSNFPWQVVTNKILAALFDCCVYKNTFANLRKKNYSISFQLSSLLWWWCNRFFISFGYSAKHRSRYVADGKMEVFHFNILTIILIRLTRGRCYDHNFRRFCQFSAKILAFFSKRQCYDEVFAKTSISLSKNAIFR
jgi:hypothetical protein